MRGPMHGTGKQIAEAVTLSGEKRVAAWNKLFRVLYEEEVPDVVLFHMAGFIAGATNRGARVASSVPRRARPDVRLRRGATRP